MSDDLDDTEWLSEEQAGTTAFLVNMPPDNRFFENHQNFFSTIGYIALQVAVLEDDIRQSMSEITEDFNAVASETERKNLGALLSLYELIFLASFKDNKQFKEWFYGVKKLLLKANQYRNEAVHQNWMFVDSNPDKPCYSKIRNDKLGYIIITPNLMRKRAIFCHNAFLYFNHLRAVIEDPEGWDPDAINEAKGALAKLASQ